MTDIVLNNITSGYNVTKINDNFDKIEEAINSNVLHTSGGNNTMDQQLDMNGYAIINAEVDINNPDSLITVGEADARYYNIDGDTLAGTMNVNNNTITNLKVPVGPTEPVRKDMFDGEVAARQQEDLSIRNDFTAADASLQDQINGTSPPMGSAFSVISWHGQHVTNSINIPANVNAWSFGPTMTIDSGNVVTVGANSFWTIANGEVSP